MSQYFPFQPSLLVGTTRITAATVAPAPVALAAGASQVVIHNRSLTTDAAVAFGLTSAAATSNAIFPVAAGAVGAYVIGAGMKEAITLPQSMNTGNAPFCTAITESGTADICVTPGIGS